MLGIFFDSPATLLAAPVAAFVLYHLFYISSTAEMTRRRRTAFYTSRVAVVSLVVVALAGPYVVGPTTVDTGDSVHVLVDGSDSMAPLESSVDDVVEQLRDEDVEVSRTRVAAGETSAVGDAVLSNVERGGELLLVSDGRVTHGTGLGEVARTAASLDARVNALDLEATGSEAYVEVSGPRVVGEGVGSTYRVSVDGTGFDSASVDVYVDGERIERMEVSRGGSEEFSHVFRGRGDHRLEARITVDDGFEANDVFRRSVRAVEPPRLLYVSRSRYPYLQSLDDLYDVDHRQTVPSDLDGYHAVVLQNLAATDVGDAGALQRHVLEGGGLVVAGGPNAYERGGYEGSLLGSMLPVREGGVEYDTDVVLLVDVSGSVEREVELNRRLAASAVESMSDDHSVAVLAFDHNVYRLTEMLSLEESRDEVLDTVRRIQPSGGSTDVYVGLRGADDVLEGGGSVVLVSDGDVRSHLESRTLEQARKMGEDGVRVVGVGVGEADHVFMRAVAKASGGTYFPAGDAGRLSLLFDDAGASEEFDGVTVLDRSHFVTRGVETTASVASTHQVKPRSTADLLAVSGDGSPVVTAWRYGSGRAVSLTGHRGDGVLGGLLQPPDRALLTRSASWAAGHPLRKRSNVYQASDGRVGDTVQVRYRGGSRPRSTVLEFRQTGDRSFVATYTPAEQGYREVGETEHAVNYPRELGGFGVSPGLRSMVSVTGGRLYESGDVSELAQDVVDREPVTRTARQDIDWLFLLLALLLYLAEVSVRRLEEVYGYRLAEKLPKPIYRWME